MADNFNINTTQAQSYEAGGIDPNNFGGTLEDALVKNQMSHQEQAELVQQAIERSKQAKIQTSEMQEDEDSGARQASKGLISKEQAITTLKTGLANSSISDEEKTQVLQDAEDTWPDVVSADGVHRMITALHEGRITKLGEGQPFKATGKEKDADGTAFPEGTYIQSVLDTDGEEHFIHSNKPPSVIKQEERGTDSEKIWQKLDGVLTQYIKGGRGQVLMNTVIRSKQALKLVLQYGDNPPKAVLGQISTDISSIMAGGAATEAGTEVASYANMLVDLNNKLGYYTGSYNLVTSWTKKLTGHTKLEEIMHNLKTTLTDLITVASDTIKSQLESHQAGYQNLIESDPARFDRMVMEKMQVTKAGLPAGALSTGEVNTEAPESSTGNPQAKVPQYTVEE